MRFNFFRVVFFSGLSAITSVHTFAVESPIYKWVDENNVVHFSHDHPIDIQYSEIAVKLAYKASFEPLESEINETEETLADDIIIEAKDVEKCKTAKSNITTLTNFDEISVTDSEGKTKILTEEEKTEQLNISNKNKETYCTD